MAKFVLIFTILFSVLLSAFPATSIHEPPEFYLQWFYDMQGQVAVPRPDGWRTPFNTVFHPGDGDGAPGRLFFPGREPVQLPEETLISAPFHGAGYFEYFKVGREILFHESSRGEVLWKKTFFSYPISDYYGNLILLLTGDNNRVDLLDPSGNPTGVGSVSGNILTDYDFAARNSRALLAFSDGRITALSKTGDILFRHRIEEDGRPFFVKSCALGPDGLVAAVHYRSGDQDRVRLIAKAEEGDGVRLLGEVVLPAVYPHLVHMAVNAGGLLVSAPNFTGFFDTDGDPVWNRPLAVAAGATPPIYRPVYADLDFYLFGENAFVFVLDQEGRMIAVMPIRDGGRPFRFLPGAEAGSFVIHTDAALHFYRFASRVSE